ncbi:cobalamin biosynthesis protein CbiD [Desulfoprunum benzoelyticum]|uniref:Cobalt-precorrin-5B C(1)-methyltransferase n=1 Tax=Desulfoprunum benzoelyticum TaxID=1506996 RepID=A0A840ULQ5_9BACT|nr:cobalt-precorrin-5B (C(1))-methyltransferase CbiD [Desulfoprunum benzoelyticum]MBB5346535.1 cobalt-precorrin-5B (C1)-methyltransferase [Desulfoprunum benzoelyticum]MBM9528936.1 cobalamin biosynthesis protein CbiD [Desulfoprunum benzoelyticum]
MKRLRSGYTTGACAAAAAKGAALIALTGVLVSRIAIPFPNGKRVDFDLCRCRLIEGTWRSAACAVIKDAGDDPDVTNGAEIVAEVMAIEEQAGGGGEFVITGGRGIGMVTKPGLSLPVGSHAINPVPRAMIREAIEEAFADSGQKIGKYRVQVKISIPNGEILARHTLNRRLGIIGGLSILGTTGVVVPISSDAWTATITASMDVAKEMGVGEIVLSTGRTSERAMEGRCRLPEEAHVMMGDYLEFSLREAAVHHFRRIHLGGMWAKILKAAMAIPQTHVRHGALDAESARAFLEDLAGNTVNLDFLQGSNTAREILERLQRHGADAVIRGACLAARDYCQSVSGLPVNVYLVLATGRILEAV